MSEVDLPLNPAKFFGFLDLALRQVCTTFEKQSLPPPILRDFEGLNQGLRNVSCLHSTGETIEVTKATFPDFSSLCNEFGFELEKASYRLGQVEFCS
jgi:hypothetical protein